MINIPTFEDVPTNDVILTIDEVIETSEEVEQETEEIQEEESVEESTEEPTEDPLARSAFESLVERGILEADEKFDGTFEALDSKFESLPNKLLRSAIDELPDHSQQILKFIATAGQNLQPEELRTFIKEFYNEQDVPDVSTLDAAREYLEAQLKASGTLRASAIQAQLDEMEDDGTMIEEAEKMLKSKTKTTDQLIKDKEAQNATAAEEQKQFVQSVNTALQETNWSKEQQQKVLRTIPKTNDVLNQVVKNPKAYVQLIDFLGKFNGKEFDLEVYLKQGETRANNGIKEKLEKTGYSSSSNKTQASTETPLESIFKDFKPVV